MPLPLLLLIVFFFLFPFPASAAEGFSQWLSDFEREAIQHGVTEKTAHTALSEAAYLPIVITLDRKQPETRITFKQYQNNVITNRRIKSGQSYLEEYRPLLSRISHEYGVPPEIILALWGIETSYGKNTGGFNVISALATLAYDGRRSDFFRAELLEALRILDEGHIDPVHMTGSWAGAMGQNQFMPSSFKKFSADGNGDGKRDIWTSVPDVFASTANYLSSSGWKAGQRWGRRVKLSKPIPASISGLEHVESLSFWKEQGIVLPNGKDIPVVEGMGASLIRPDGLSGEAFLVYDNYRIIMKWNKSTYFATSVGLLSDLIAQGK